jgi:tRNA dimethylallyltransferase
LPGPLPAIIALTGPTAVGKTEVALALAQHLPVTIISMDSAMVYRGLDIGSAKPDRALLERYPHALVDIRDPSQPYSAADFVADADEAVRQARDAGRLPLLVGGTMLYLKAFREGLAPMPGADAQLRARLREEARSTGWPALHERLRQLDPEAAQGIHPNNVARIERALEICELTGEKMSSFWAATAEHRVEQRLGLPLREFAIMPDDRKVLHQRIAARVDQMLATGLVDEVRTLYQRGDLHPELPAIRAVGYRQVWAVLDGELAESSLPEKITVATRQLAKRQLTWLRGWGTAQLQWGDSQRLAARIVQAAAP